jgi:hypothetical protein
MMNDNVIEITDRINNWKLIEEFFDAESNSLKILGNYRKNSHFLKLKITDQFGKQSIITLGLMEIALLQNAIKDYEDR